jgi:hypothetical protein
LGIGEGVEDMGQSLGGNILRLEIAAVNALIVFGQLLFSSI